VPSPSLEEKRHDVPPDVVRATKRRRPADHVGFVNITVATDIRARAQEQTHRLHVPASRGEMQRRGVIAGITSVRICAILQEQRDDVAMTVCRRRMQGSAAARVMGTDQIGFDREHLLHHVLIPLATRLDKPGDSFSLSLLNMRFQRPPTGEAGVSCHCQERRCQLGLRIRSAQGLQALLRELLQELERRAFRELTVRHRPLPSLAPGVRVSRAGSKGL
jgi:hypothetical protein